MHRKCPICGATLDPCELCDCEKEKAASGEEDREAAKEDLQHYDNK